MEVLFVESVFNPRDVVVVVKDPSEAISSRPTMLAQEDLFVSFDSRMTKHHLEGDEFISLLVEAVIYRSDIFAVVPSLLNTVIVADPYASLRICVDKARNAP